MWINMRIVLIKDTDRFAVLITCPLSWPLLYARRIFEHLRGKVLLRNVLLSKVLRSNTFDVDVSHETPNSSFNQVTDP